MEKNKLAAIDADTIIYQAAFVVQETPIEVIHKINPKHKKEFKNITAFRAFLKEKKGYHEDDFFCNPTPRVIEPIENALHTIKSQIKKIHDKGWCDDFRVYVGGEGNYRKDIATLKPYKGDRPPKPLVYTDCYNYVLNKYKDRVVVCNGEEAEDGVAILAWPSYQKARVERNRDVSDVVICHVDKDLLQVPGWHYNYGKDNSELNWISDAEAYRHFWWQMLVGDPTDCIIGLENVTEKLRTKYALKKSNGCGPVAAQSILASAKNEKECAERVIEAYKDFHSDGWEKVFNENGILLRMRSFEGEMWNAVDYCKKLGVF